MPNSKPPDAIDAPVRNLVLGSADRYSHDLMKAWLQLALQPSVVRRALRYAVVVGIILISINHLDAILRGEVTRGRIFKMALTVLVPYVVSTLSSVGALRQRDRSQTPGA